MPYKMSSFRVICSLMSIVMTVSLVLSQEFCADTNPIERIFFMAEQTFIVKGQSYYRQRTGMTFAGTKGMGPTVYFTTVYWKINTGFAITRIPKCTENTTHCNDTKKLWNKGFIIGHKSPFAKQAYVAYRYILVPPSTLKFNLTSTAEMPFGLKNESEIEKQAFWPESAGDAVVYLHSAFDEQNLLILHLILISGVETLYTIPLLTSGWGGIRSHKPRLNNNEMPVIYGFFLMNETLYAISESSENTETIIIHDLDGLFSQENNLTIEADLTGCQVVTVPPQEPTTTQLTEVNEKTTASTALVGTNGTQTGQGQTDAHTSSPFTTTRAQTRQESKGSSSWIWFLVFLIGIPLILSIILIIALTVIRNRNKNENKVVSQPKIDEESTIRSK